MQIGGKRPLMISRGWVQSATVVLIVGFLILGVLTYSTYHDEPPIPRIVTTTSGSILFTTADIMAGQQVFLGSGLMEYGSIFGHGAYLGPDFTTEYLHRAALSSIEFYAASTLTERVAERYRTPSRIDMTVLPASSLIRMRRRTPLTSTGLTTNPFWRANYEVRIAAKGNSRSGRDPEADGLLQLNCMGRLDRSAWPFLFLYE